MPTQIEMTPEQAALAKAAESWPVSPTNPEKRITYRMLAHDVMVVAHVWPLVGDFRAYIGAVPGKDHDNEIEPVLAYGAKVPEAIARAVFPDSDALTYWRF